MGGNYEKGIYNQLMDVMARLDAMENQLLRDDNARLKSIIHNDNSNTSFPPSTDQKVGRSANTYMAGKKQNGSAAGRKAIKGPPLPKQKRKKKSGKRHVQ